ncbi:MAG: type II toxin-antitoxin system RelE/ParE family toxin [Roseburia sp.]|nr:type II toxin-antitoxin system RelE/ParE family toxin [Anaeroplasma bactoclasticum]MCM1196779.1 type II toxin-antitoxin system RelE/ParE family toxin [Roseburia sp.]MCM1556102.1 type II toxin-antitoxin system RelE/ParE family toxin [Anaeroplasma bactoclasticum]
MPNKFTFKITPLAESDIDLTLSYIAIHLCNEKAASNLYLKIEETIEMVCMFPFSSADCKCFLISDENIRHVPIDNYCLIYEIKEEEKRLDILRFCFSKMDLTKMSFK